MTNSVASLIFLGAWALLAITCAVATWLQWRHGREAHKAIVAQQLATIKQAEQVMAAQLLVIEILVDRIAEGEEGRQG